MKKFLLITTFAFYYANSFGQSYPAGEYELITNWSDEFASTSMNTSKWQHGWQTWAEYCVFNPNNVTYGQAPSISGTNDNKVCNILTQYVTTPQQGVSGWETNLNPIPKYSNMICGDLYLKSVCKYGYFETRMKEPSSSINICSAFWLWGGNDEIDIQENSSDTRLTNDRNNPIQFPNKSVVRNAIRYGLNSKGDPDWPYSRDVPIRDNYGNLIDISQAFHVYGLDWQPDFIDFYFDGTLISHVPNSSSFPISNFDPMYLVFWTKVITPPGITSNPPAGHNTLEIDYFHYYKRKPTLSSAAYNYSSNIITLNANTGNSGDTYNWVPSNNLTINGATNTNVANISLSPSYNGTSVTVSTTGTKPPATSSSTYIFQQNSGNLCGNMVHNNVYLGSDISAPMSGCSSVVVLSGTNVSFVASNSITLNPGFEVQLGGTFNALTQ